MKTNRALGFAGYVSLTTLTLFGGAALIPACSGNQADVVEEPDGAPATDAPVGTTTPDATTGTPDTGTPVGTPDTGSTFIDTGTTIPDAGTPTADTGTPVGSGDGGACPPATCTADSDCACLTASGSIGCCDTVTTACFQSASSVCPDQQTTGTPDSGGGGY